MYVPENEEASIVMVGSFNPAIFQPRWLGALDLIRKKEAENAEIAIIQAEIADFKTEWFHLQALQNRFQISCDDPTEYAPLRDLVASIFTTLPHTPVSLLGINRSFHFRMPSDESWHEIGHKLTPKPIWSEVLDSPGMRSVWIEGKRKDGRPGIARVRAEPSSRVMPHGLFLEVNDEFKAPEDRIAEGAQWVVERLKEEWDAAMVYAEKIADYFRSLV
jgi:hypothetical protein